MAITQLRGNQIEDGSIKRADLNVSEPGSSVIRKVIAGTGVSLTSTGVDPGTGDVIVNVSLSPESNPAFTYTNGLITRIDYTSGNYKILSYTNSRLTQLDYIISGTTRRKTFNYDLNGYLTSITETTF